MKDVSIVIVNHNASALLKDALTSVLERTEGVDYEIIVVDNASTDNSLQMLRDSFTDNVEVIVSEKNLGFAKANNIGISHSQGRNILLLNPDTRLKNNAVKKMSDFLDAHPEAAACGGNLTDENGKEQFSFWTLLPGIRFDLNELTSNVFLKLKHHGSIKYNHTGKEKEVAYVIGADIMVRREVIDGIGLLDEDFFLFFEETEWCRRMHEAGYKIFSLPDAQIIHLESQTIGDMMKRQKYMMASRKIYMDKCLTPLQHYISDLIFSINCRMRYLWFVLTRNKLKQQFWIYRLKNIQG